jgi:hypothetical protein
MKEKEVWGSSVPSAAPAPESKVRVGGRWLEEAWIVRQPWRLPTTKEGIGQVEGVVDVNVASYSERR